MSVPCHCMTYRSRALTPEQLLSARLRYVIHFIFKYQCYVPIIFITAQSIVRIGKEPEPEKKERVGLWATFKLNMQIFSAAAVAAASTWVRVIYYHGSWVDFSSSGRAANSSGIQQGRRAAQFLCWAGWADFLFFCQKKRGEMKKPFSYSHIMMMSSLLFLFDVRGGMMKKNEWIG